MTQSDSAIFANRQRVAVCIFFFIQGISFATWASRIPDIKRILDLNDAEIGSLLLVMPFSSLLGLAISGWINRNFDNRPPLIVAMVVQCASIMGIGMSTSIIDLGISLFFLSLAFRIGGVAMNTQAVMLQKSFAKPINGSFHAMWSLGGIVGVGLTTSLIWLSVSMSMHLFWTAITLVSGAIITFKYLPSGDKATSGSKIQIGKPDKSLLLLGLIILFASFCEGGMFDWSGIYFKEVIKVDIYTIGYFTFMMCMALSRWFMDKVISKIGKQTVYLISSILITFGILISTVFPFFIPAIIGFSMVGIGAAVLVPITFSLAGESKKYSPGMAISIISTYSVVGMLIGPPLIGFLSHAIGMKWAFLFIALMGACILPASRWYFRVAKTENEE